MITHEILKEMFFYNTETGVFTNLVRRSSRSPAGARADKKSRGGYLAIKFKGKTYLAHRMAWFYMTGKMPENLIDHINMVRNDNRFCNIREATHSENHQNIKTPPSTNKSGFLGVSLHRQTNKWRSQIKLESKVKHLGLFNTKEDAHEAYLKAKRQIHAHCTI